MTGRAAEGNWTKTGLERERERERESAGTVPWITRTRYPAGKT